MTPERQERINYVLNHRQPDLVVVMENVHDPHNIAAVMRTCDSVGVQEIFVLNTQIAPHKKFGKKSSASAAGWLTIHHFENTQACVDALKERGLKILATHLSSDAISLYDAPLADPVALVFGNEHAGVTEELLQYCDGNFIIPQVGMVKSLNISVACAVSLYEAYRQRLVKGCYNGECRLAPPQKAELISRWGLEDSFSI